MSARRSRRSPERGTSMRMTACAVVVLPQPDSPTSATSSPAATRQRDAVDRAHDALLAARQRAHQAARERIVHDEVAHVEQRRAGAHAAEPAARWHAARWRRADGAAAAGAARGRSRTSSRSAARTGRPTSGASRRGGAPGMDATPRRARRDRAWRRTACACTGCRGASCSAAVGPSSAIAAGVHHGRRLAGLRDDRQVVRDQHDREAELVGEPHEQLQDLRLHHHVERGRGLVGEQHPRIAGERHRDRRALAHAARELVREAPRALGADADELEQLAAARLRGAARSPMPCSSIASTIWLPMRCTGLKAFIAPWKTIAMSVQRCGRTRVLAAGEDVLAVQQHAPGDARVGRQEPHEREAEGRLAAAGLADEAHALAAREREARALHGVQLAALRRGRTRRAGPAPRARALRSRRVLGRRAGRRRKRRTERWLRAGAG